MLGTMVVTTALLHFQTVHRDNYPAFVERGDGWVLIVADLTMTMLGLTTFIVEQTAAAEQNLYRRAYGIGPVGTSIPDLWFRDEPVPPWIPEPLRLPAYSLPERRVGCRIQRGAYDLLGPGPVAERRRAARQYEETAD